MGMKRDIVACGVMTEVSVILTIVVLSSPDLAATTERAEKMVKTVLGLMACFC